MSIYNKGNIKSWFEKWGLTVLILLILSTFTVSSQDDRRSRRERRKALTEIKADTAGVPVLTDSMRAVNDSIARADSIHRVDSLQMLEKSSLDAPAFTAARDSIVEDFSDGKKMIYYYGVAVYVGLIMERHGY